MAIQEQPVEINMNMFECPSFEGYSAPLCPLGNNSERIWYPGEEVCRRKNSKTWKLPNWVLKQRKITKLGADTQGYFTVAMLKSISRVSRGIVGINPDRNLKATQQAEKKWGGITPSDKVFTCI